MERFTSKVLKKLNWGLGEENRSINLQSGDDLPILHAHNMENGYDINKKRQSKLVIAGNSDFRWFC